MVAGERETYLRTSAVSASGTFHKHRVRYVISATDGESGTILKEAASGSDQDLRGTGTFPLHFGNSTWTLGDGTAQYNFGYDTRLYCGHGNALIAGQKWECDVVGIPRWSPAGHVNVSVLSISGTVVKLDVVGESQPVHGTQVDSDTGKQYDSVTSSKWHDRLTIDGGLLQQSVRDFDTEIDVGNLRLPSHEHEEINLESRTAA